MKLLYELTDGAITLTQLLSKTGADSGFSKALENLKGDIMLVVTPTDADIYMETFGIDADEDSRLVAQGDSISFVVGSIDDISFFSEEDVELEVYAGMVSGGDSGTPITSPIQIKGTIAVASDFPTLAAVQDGWFYVITDDVTDNDAAKTNTGDVFEDGDQIFWLDGEWIVGENIYVIPTLEEVTDQSGLTPSDDDIIQRKSGAWTTRSMSQLKTDLVLVKADVGLGNVDNTADVDKPISDDTQDALDLKQDEDADLTTIAGLTPTNDDILQRKSGAWINRTMAQLKTDLVLVKADVGLGNVDNTSDANKPVSTATQTALDLKQNIDSDLTAIAALTPTNDDIIQRKSGAWTNRTMAQLKTDLVLVKADVGLGNVDNTADTAKPVSTAQQTALNGKQDLDSDLTSIAALTPTNDDIIQRKSGAWTNRTMAQLKTDLVLVKADVGLGNVTNDAQLKAADLDTDGTLAANSDAKIASQKATKTYADTKIASTQKAAASGVASLNSSTKVVEDPANATATATASKIPIADGSGKLDTWVSDASDTVKGKVELAIASEVTTGSDATRAVTPDALAGSNIFGVKAIQIQVVETATDVDGTSGIAYFYAPRAIDGMNLVRATAMVDTAGTTNATTIQIRNMTKYSSNDALSSAISIASAGVVATAGTVNTTYDDVSTDDKIKVYVTGQSTTKPKGLWVVLEYQLP